MARLATASGSGANTLGSVMEAPSTTTPDVVVLDALDEDVKPREVADPRRDLWLSSSDGYVLSDRLCARLASAILCSKGPRRVRTCTRFIQQAMIRYFADANNFSRRHQSPIVPIRVGPHAETFYVHRDILTKSEYFRKALDGEFREAGDQAMDLPEEDPAIFSFVVAFLYEERYMPIKPIAAVLG